MSVRDGLQGMDKITLPHHVEFLSDRWLEEAERILGEVLPARKPQLDGRPFSPRFGEMLGADDGFDRLTPAGGRDYLRLEPTRQLHAFTHQQMKEILREPEAAAA